MIFQGTAGFSKKLFFPPSMLAVGLAIYLFRFKLTKNPMSYSTFFDVIQTVLVLC